VIPATGEKVDTLGARLKVVRIAAGMTLRELARQADVSPSFVSQIENGRSQPSVATLYTFAQLLGVAVDDLFGGERAPDADHPALGWQPSERANTVSVIHPTDRAHLDMAAGIEWERLAATPERAVNYMKITYAPGASSSEGGVLQQHDGYEYGYVLSGVIEVTIGDELFVLHPGESLGFDSRIAHSLRNPGTTDFEGLWIVHGPNDQLHRHRNPSGEPA
jgi:transcriptional regulator with XRE-family HTH domain